MSATDTLPTASAPVEQVLPGPAADPAKSLSVWPPN